MIACDTSPPDPTLLRRMREVEGLGEMGMWDDAMRAMVMLPAELKDSHPVWVLETWARIYAGQRNWSKAENMGRALIAGFPHRVFGYEIVIEALKSKNTPAHLQRAEEIRRHGANTLLNLGKSFANDSQFGELALPCLKGAVKLNPQLTEEINASRQLRQILNGGSSLAAEWRRSNRR